MVNFQKFKVNQFIKFRVHYFGSNILDLAGLKTLISKSDTNAKIARERVLKKMQLLVWTWCRKYCISYIFCREKINTQNHMTENSEKHFRVYYVVCKKWYFDFPNK